MLYIIKQTKTVLSFVVLEMISQIYVDVLFHQKPVRLIKSTDFCILMIKQ